MADLGDEYTIQFKIENFGAILADEDGALVYFPVDHTIGQDIAEIAITLLDKEFYVNPFALLGLAAPLGASYVVMAADPTLTDERVLTVTPDLELADGGAGGNATLGIELAREQARILTRVSLRV